MNIPVNIFMWLLACLPIIVLLVLMIKFQWGATDAAPIGLAITIFTGIVFYKADLKVIVSEASKGIWNALTILVIVWTAVLLYQVGNETRAFLVIRDGMRRLLPNELLLVLAMGWIFESFLQGITGFGVPVAVGAPLLIGIGVKPMWAVIIPLLGQSWGNTFGTLAAAWDALVMSAGISSGSKEYLITAFWTALFIWFWNLIIGITICWFYGKGKAIRKGFLPVLLLSLVQGGGELLLTQVNTTIACFVPACISLIVILLLGRLPGYKQEWSVRDSRVMDREKSAEKGEEKPEGMTLIHAFVPYFLLSVIALIVLLVEPVHTLLGKVQIGFSFPETVTGYGYVNEAVESFSPWTPFTHASMFLFASAVIGMIYYKKKGWIASGGIGRIFLRAVSMTMPSGMAIIGLVIMSKIMAGTGQTEVLANGIAGVLGKVYVIFSPFIGLLGSFMTGSNMSSNILFAGFQSTTANLLDVHSAIVLGAQSSGASIGSAPSPSNIVLGTTTANILGSEGKVLRKIIVITVPAALMIGVFVLALTSL